MFPFKYRTFNVSSGYEASHFEHTEGAEAKVVFEEEHPELPASPVLLGLLGRSLFNTGVVSPQPAANDVSFAMQQTILDTAYASARS